MHSTRQTSRVDEWVSLLLRYGGMTYRQTLARVSITKAVACVCCIVVPSRDRSLRIARLLFQRSGRPDKPSQRLLWTETSGARSLRGRTWPRTAGAASAFKHGTMGGARRNRSPGGCGSRQMARPRWGAPSRVIVMPAEHLSGPAAIQTLAGGAPGGSGERHRRRRAANIDEPGVGVGDGRRVSITRAVVAVGTASSAVRGTSSGRNKPGACRGGAEGRGERVWRSVGGTRGRCRPRQGGS